MPVWGWWARGWYGYGSGYVLGSGRSGSGGVEMASPGMTKVGGVAYRGYFELLGDLRWVPGGGGGGMVSWVWGRRRGDTSDAERSRGRLFLLEDAGSSRADSERGR
jgi:hypothetical protein